MKHYARPSTGRAACGRGGSGEVTSVASDVQCAMCQRTFVYYVAVTGLTPDQAHEKLTDALRQYGWPKGDEITVLKQYPQGPEMKSAPANMRMEAVVDLLRHGHSVYVQLEPGDATRYDLLLVAMGNVAPAAYVTPLGWETDGQASNSFLPAAGGLPEWGEEYSIMLVRLIDMKPAGAIICAPGMYNEPFAVVANGNAWTMRVLEWWMNELWAAIKMNG